MAEVHVESGAGNVSPFATWANAATTLSGANAVTVAGDSVLFSPTHLETNAGVNLTIAGTATSPTRLLCGVKGTTSGITALTTGASVGSSNTTFTLNGNFYVYGLLVRCTTSSSMVANINNASSAGSQHWDTCRFEHQGTGPSSYWKFGSGTSNASVNTLLTNCVFKFGNVNQRVTVDGPLRIMGGGFDGAGAVTITAFGLAPSARGAILHVEDFDLSGCATTLDLIGTIGQSGCSALFRRIKLPASWTGRLVNPTLVRLGDRFEMIDFSSGSTLYRLWIEDYAGQIRDENTIKVTANIRSYKLVTTANSSLLAPLRSNEFYVPLSGAAQTLALDICTDNVTLTDAEAYIEVDLFETNGSYLGTTKSDAAANVLATPANQPTSSTTWTTTGLTTPVRQVLAVTVTAGSASYGIARAVIRKPSTTVYLDNRVTVS